MALLQVLQQSVALTGLILMTMLKQDLEQETI
jgi:hypothetical protein